MAAARSRADGKASGQAARPVQACSQIVVRGRERRQKLRCALQQIEGLLVTPLPGQAGPGVPGSRRNAPRATVVAQRFGLSSSVRPREAGRACLGPGHGSGRFAGCGGTDPRPARSCHGRDEFRAARSTAGMSSDPVMTILRSPSPFAGAEPVVPPATPGPIVSDERRDLFGLESCHKGSEPAPRRFGALDGPLRPCWDAPSMTVLCLPGASGLSNQRQAARLSSPDAGPPLAAIGVRL